jgi:uncharacterized protein (DUF302 family)
MDTGIRTLISTRSVEDVVTWIQSLLHDRGIKLFAIVDHCREAKSVGLEMPPTKLLIFGSPRAGTPLMISAPSTALDLPLKILVAQNENGQTLLSWNKTAWLEQRHGFAGELTANIAAVEMIAQKAAR